MCLSDGNELDEMCSVEDNDTCGDGGWTTTQKYVEILEFRHFESFFRFDQSDRTGEISIGSYQFSIYKIYWGKI